MQTVLSPTDSQKLEKVFAALNGEILLSFKAMLLLYRLFMGRARTEPFSHFATRQKLMTLALVLIVSS